MLTPDKIAAFNKITGINAPANGGPIVPSRADQVMKIAQQAKQEKETEAERNRIDPQGVNQDPIDQALGSAANAIGGLAKSVVSAPATILARPVQAVAELAGASDTDVNKWTDKLTGGLVSHVPENAGDVEKDVGRGIQTVALGLGPIAGGAAFGLGNSLEQGNDLFSVQTALQTVLGAGAGKVLDLIGKPVFNAAGKAIGKVTPEFLSDLASKGTKAVEDFAAAHDILPEPISNAVNKGADSLNNAGDAISNTIDAAGNKVKKGVVAAKDIVKSGFIPNLSPEEATGQIVQGGTEDIGAAKRSLSSMDTTGVKTYKDLQGKINNEIKTLAPQVDAELEKGGRTGKSIKSFEQTVGEGKSGVRVNHVEQALDDLEHFYTKTNDATGLSKVKAIRNNAKIKGMSYKDVNDLAKLHGRTINAFNANGEAASGLSKQAAENTRRGLKDIARQALGGPEAQALDARLSDLYDTQSLIDSMVEKVQKASQKTVKKGVIPKLVGHGIKALDIATGNPLKAIGKEIGLQSGGVSALSPTEIEASLENNLKTLRGK